MTTDNTMSKEQDNYNRALDAASPKIYSQAELDHELALAEERGRKKAFNNLFVSWDTAEKKDNWVVQFWRVEQDGTRTIVEELSKSSDEGGMFRLGALTSEKENV